MTPTTAKKKVIFISLHRVRLTKLQRLLNDSTDKSNQRTNDALGLLSMNETNMVQINRNSHAALFYLVEAVHIVSSIKMLVHLELVSSISNLAV